MPVVQGLNQWSVGISKQSAEGSAAAAADYDMPVFSGRPAPVQDTDVVNVTDANAIQGDPYKKPGEHWEAGIEVPAYPAAAGRFLQSLWPTDTITAGTTFAISASSASASIATFTTAAHPFQVGDVVIVAGMTPAGYNGTWTVLTVADTTHFTANIGTTPGVGTVFGTAALASHVFTGLGAVQWIGMWNTAFGGANALYEKYVAGLCSSIGFSADSNGGPLKLAYSAIGETPSVLGSSYTITSAVTLATAGYFTVTGASLKYDLSTPDAGPAAKTNVQSFNVQVARSADPVLTADGTTMSNVAAGKITPSVDLTFLWTDWQAYRASFFGAVAGSAASTAVVKGALEIHAVHSGVPTPQTNWDLKLYVPRVAFMADPVQPDPGGGPATVTVKGLVFKPTSGDHVQPTLTNGVSTAY